jgi:hypothetical protein
MPHWHVLVRRSGAVAYIRTRCHANVALSARGGPRTTPPDDCHTRRSEVARGARRRSAPFGVAPACARVLVYARGFAQDGGSRVTPMTVCWSGRGLRRGRASCCRRGPPVLSAAPVALSAALSAAPVSPPRHLATSTHRHLHASPPRTSTHRPAAQAITPPSLAAPPKPPGRGSAADETPATTLSRWVDRSVVTRTTQVSRSAWRLRRGKPE